MRSHLLIALPLVALVASCTVGPDYHAPEPRLASQWTGSATPGAVEQGAWWKALNDPLLDTLVDEMLAKSPTLREAQILSELRRSIDAVFLPRPLRLVPRLPRNETGKLPRDALQRLLRG